MIVLDTNVLSGLMRGTQPVIAWLNRQPSESIWITAVTVFEVRFGLELMASGRRRRALEAAFTQALDQDLEGRVLPFDPAAARHAASIAVRQRQSGRTIEIRDVQIAGIAATRRAVLATRNLWHYLGVGIQLVDPWTAA